MRRLPLVGLAISVLLVPVAASASVPDAAVTRDLVGGSGPAAVATAIGDVSVRGHVAMVNVIGQEPDAAAILAIPGAHLHSYGKQARQRRKLGHVTLLADDPETLRERVVQVSGHLTDA